MRPGTFGCAQFNCIQLNGQKEKGISPLFGLLDAVNLDHALLGYLLFRDLDLSHLAQKSGDLLNLQFHRLRDVAGGHPLAILAQSGGDGFLNGGIGDCRLGRGGSALGVALVQFGQGIDGELDGVGIVGLVVDYVVVEFAVRHGVFLSRY